MNGDRDERDRRDAELVLRFREADARGDRRERDRAFEAIFERCNRVVHAHCIARLAPDYDAAQEAAQETFVIAYENMGDLRDPRRLVPWMLGIASNVVRAGARRRPFTVSMDALPDEGAVERALRDGDEEDMAGVVHRAFVGQWLAQIAETLPESQRTLHELIVGRGLAGAELARELNVPVAEAYRRLYDHTAIIRRSFEANVVSMANDPGKCPRLTRILRDAEHRGTVLSGALRDTVVRHIGKCKKVCQQRCAKDMVKWAPALLPVLFEGVLRERVMDDVRLVSTGERLDARNNDSDGGDDVREQDAHDDGGNCGGTDSGSGHSATRPVRCCLPQAASPSHTSARAPKPHRGARKRRRTVVGVLVALLIAATSPAVWPWLGQKTDAMTAGGGPSPLSWIPGNPFDDDSPSPASRPDSQGGRRPHNGSAPSAVPPKDGGGKNKSPSTGGNSGDTGKRGGDQRDGGGSGGDQNDGDGNNGDAGNEGNGGDGGNNGDGNDQGNDGGGNDAGVQPPPPPPPVTREIGLHLSSSSDAYAASRGIEVVVAGASQGVCTGAGANCPYTARDGDTVTLRLVGSNTDYVHAWGSGPCSSAPSSGPCTFTIDSDTGFNLNLRYEPG
ncbi:sigma-70 family RNA polymerase sigma factor [Actinomadura fulvescens]|uniref:RNA polymerase sigma-70 region 2 domain-containing protein n=1 Tax=Actinomadura fulvescens TaxID=46160 RepID=A0ABN3QGV2_9ACTN